MSIISKASMALAGILLLGGIAHASDDATKCEAAKLKIAGKYGFCRLKEESKAAKTGGTADFSKCDDKLTFKWAQAETAAGASVCPSEGDASALQAFITQHTDDVAVALGGGPLPDCAAALACGNGVIDTGEHCDLGTLNGETCVTRGFAGGTLSCANGCTFDTGDCWNARLIDNADGTITDHATGLMWEKKTELDGSTNFANLHDADDYYPWAGTCSVNTSKFCQPTTASAALCAANAEGGTTGCDECMGADGTCSSTDTVWTWAVSLNTASVAGHTDWRVPKRRELEGILDLFDGTSPAIDVAFQGASCGGACTDITDPACSCTPGTFGLYWSASTDAPIPYAAWIVDFDNASVDATGRDYDGYYVRAVRGGS